MVEPEGVIVAEGALLTVTAVDADVALQPLLPVTVTLYEPETVALMLCVVVPLLHKYAEPVEAVNATLPPWQKVVAPPAVMVEVGKVFTTTITGADVDWQVPLVTVTA